MENVKYAVSNKVEPELYQSAFLCNYGSNYATKKYYGLFAFDELDEGESVFDDANKAIGFARTILSETPRNILYVIAVNENKEVSCIAQIV